MGVTQDKRNGGGCSDTLAKGVLIMEIMQMILIIAFTALLVDLIKNIKKLLIETPPAGVRIRKHF